MTHNSDFPLTAEGYTAAKQWLIDNNHYDKIQRGWSTDGYSVVALANTLKNKHGSEHHE